MNYKRLKKEVLLQPALGDWTVFKPKLTDRSRQRSFLPFQVKFSEKDISMLNSMFIAQFERYFEAMKKNIQMPLVLNGLSVETMTAVDILKDIDIPVSQFKIISPDLEDPFICFDMNFSGAIINMAVGGDIDSRSMKSLTEIEENVLSLALYEGIGLLFSNMAKNVSLEYLNSPNMYFEGSLSDKKYFFVVKADVDFGKKDIGSAFLIISPDVAKRMLLEKESARRPFNADRIPADISSKIFIEARVLLGATTISAQDLYGIEVGDVIELDSQINNLLPVEINDGLNLLGQPGIKNDRFCVKILRGGTGKVERIRIENIAVPDEKESLKEQAGTSPVNMGEKDSVYGEGEEEAEGLEDEELISEEEDLEEELIEDEEEEEVPEDNF